MAAKEERVESNKTPKGISLLRAIVLSTLLFAVSNSIRLYPVFLDSLEVMLISMVLLVLLQFVLRKHFKISLQEVVVIYAFYSFAIAASAFLRPLLDIVTYTSFQILGNMPGYADVAQSISSVLLIHDTSALMPVFTGGASSVQWGPWLVPLAMWCAIFGAMAFLFLVLSSLFYHRWAVHERLSFPLITPVISVTESVANRKDAECSLKNRAFLIGLIVSGLIVFLNFLHKHWPAVPAVVLEFPIHELFDGEIGYVLRTYEHGTWFRVNPLWMGFAFISATDFSFTFWFFYLVNRISMLFFHFAGLGSNVAKQFREGQFIGGVLAIGLFMLWLNRDTVKSVFKAALKGTEVDREEYPMSPRLMVFGSVIAIVFLIIVGNQMLSIELALFIPFLLGLLLRAITFSRLRADAAIPYDNFELQMALTVRSMFGDTAFRRDSIVGMAFVDRHPTSWDFMAVGPRAMEALKLGDSSGVKRSSVLKGLAVMFIVACIVGSFFTVKLWSRDGLQQYGAGNLGQVNVGRVVGALPLDAEPTTVTYVGLGALMSVLFNVMRVKYLWWPFHPLAYIAAWEMNYVFRFPGSFFLAWLIKVAGVRWFGGSFYNKAKPFFVALILGTAGMSVITKILDLLIAAF